MTTDEIISALLESHSADLPTIRRYITWVKIRRAIHNRFYTPAHWVQSARRYHWLGR